MMNELNHQPSHLGPTLASLALAMPDALAVSDDVSDASRAEWSRRAMLCAAAAWAKELEGEDERVMLICPNSRAFFACWLGTILAGATVLPVHVLTPPAVLGRLAREAGVTRIAHLNAPAIASTDLPSLPMHDLRQLDCSCDEFHAAIALAQADHRSGGVLLQSSGTTGLPKLVHRAIDALEHTSFCCRHATSMTASDSLLVTTALSHSYMVDHALLAATMAGASVHVSTQFEPAGLAQLARNTRATMLPTVPFVLDMLSNTPGIDPADFSTLRLVYTAGTNLPPQVAHAFAARFGQTVAQVYGSSEFGSVTWQPPPPPESTESLEAPTAFNVSATSQDPLPVGSAMAGVDIRIVNLDTPDIAKPLLPGEQGQIAIATPAMMSAYQHQSRDDGVNVTADVLTDPATQKQYFLSGDLGYLDHAGQLFVTGRLKLLVDVAGQKVNLMEVEGVLLASADVKQAAVVPVVITPTLTRLKAYVVWEQDAPGDEHARITRLRQWARSRLMAYKLPRVFQSVPSLPCSPTGKILRSELPAD